MRTFIAFMKWGVFLAASMALTARAEGPMASLRRSHERITQLLKKESKNGTPTQSGGDIREEIKKVVNSFLDYKELALRGLDQHWSARTKKEQEEFVTILRELIERNYVKQLRDNLDYEVLYKREHISGGEATVETVIRIMKRGRPVDTAISYQMKRSSSGWLVFDVITDDVSLIRTYRSQFNRIILRESYEALVKKMRRKLNET